MVTNLFSVFVKLNKTDKDYTKYLLVSNNERVLLVNNSLFVIFDNFEDFKKETEFKDIMSIGIITL